MEIFKHSFIAILVCSMTSLSFAGSEEASQSDIRADLEQRLTRYLGGANEEEEIVEFRLEKIIETSRGDRADLAEKALFIANIVNNQPSELRQSPEFKRRVQRLVGSMLEKNGLNEDLSFKTVWKTNKVILVMSLAFIASGIGLPYYFSEADHLLRELARVELVGVGSLSLFGLSSLGLIQRYTERQGSTRSRARQTYQLLVDTYCQGVLELSNDQPI